MLISELQKAPRPPLLRFVGLDTTDVLLDDARRRHAAAAEAAARCGYFEIRIDSKGREASATWSPGIHRLLGRPQQADPLTREQYISLYVHADDRPRLLASTAELFAGDSCCELEYRLITPDNPMLHVRESISEIGMLASGRLIFSTLQENPLPQALQRESKQARASVPNGHGAAPPTLHAIIAACDALQAVEKRRLQREMHDDFGQLLAAMKLDLCMLENSVTPQVPGPALQHVQALQTLVDTMITSMRRIIADEPPKAIEDHGLAGAIGQLAGAVRQRHAIEVRLTLGAGHIALPAALEQSLYRIVQESLNNVIRHAHARTVDICMRCEGERFELQISDDGRGATPADLRKPDSYGLLWMRERVTALGGELSIASGCGTGTRLQVSVPHRGAPERPVV